LNAPAAEGLERGNVRKVARGAMLFRSGDAFRCFYQVRLGTFKTITSGRDGREQVTGFQIAGDLLGHDGLAEGRYDTTAVALEDSEVIELLHEQRAGSVDAAVPALLSREIVREHKLMLLLGTGMDADQRLASFLLNLSHRLEARGYSGTEFHLRMTRADIGSYLGLKLETVSRTFTSFEERGLLRVRGRHVSELDREGLRRFFASS
jgi:CRP/FNR family transcriptional regulator